MARVDQYIYRGAKDAADRQPGKRSPYGHDHGCHCDRCVAYWDGWQAGINDDARRTINRRRADR